MASQEEKVEGTQAETTEAEDKAKFSGAWDELEAAESGQSAPAAERQEETDKGKAQVGDEAGQGAAQAGQPAADTTPGTDADEASRGKTTDDGTASAAPDELAKEREERLKAQNLARSNGSRLAKALNELSALQKQIAEKGGGDGSETTDEELEKLKQDYPEVAEPLLKRLDKLTSTVESLSTAATARAESDVADALTGEFEVLQASHPDVQSIVQAPEYAKWLEGQAPSIQRIVQENSKAVVSAADTALVFDKFKADTGFGKAPEPTAAEKTAAQLRADQLEAGRSATGQTQPGIRSDAKQDGTYESEWDRLEAADKQKKAAGRR